MKLFRIRMPFLATALLMAGLFSIQHATAVGTPSGIVISNQATVDFTDANGNALQVLSNIVTTTVSQVAGVIVDPDNSSTGVPGDLVYYAHRVTNTGNNADTINLSAVSSQGWAVQFWADAGVIGVFDAGDVLLGDSDGDGSPDPGVLIADAFFDILVEVTVPGATVDGTVDTTTVTGTSLFDPLVTESAVNTTTIAAPTLAVVKSVAPAGNQPPATTLTYTVLMTNNGTGAATAVVVNDPIPANTTYVTGSAAGAGTTIEYSHDGGGSYDASDAAPVTHIRWTLAAALAAGGGSATVSFQVIIN
ncbi:MAG: DUF11 domain-containing protein [Acidobacteria bacterium]|nr:DUF11 domain-containing protein [Acidobacteriota bacterium]